MIMSWALNGYMENDAAMVGTDVGISLHSNFSYTQYRMGCLRAHLLR